MAFIQKTELYDLYTESVKDGKEWRRDYKEYERLADNDLSDDLDESLPEVNDGSLAASLFKLPKRIVSSKLKGRAKASDRDEAWVTELANMQWENNIVPNANSQAPFIRKWKDAVRKAGIYGGQPIITLFVERGDYTGADFIVPQAQDVTLEAGKVSDYDSDVIFWDVYFTKTQLEDIIEQAKAETKDAKKKNGAGDGYNKWDVQALENILKSHAEESKDADKEPNSVDAKAVKRSGYKFCIVFQRGIKAPFYMYHASTKKTVREWENPDPTGDIPVHYLYCYQDFVNPYGIGIVKMAGGTQNVLDYMRQADILATQLGLRPPKKISGDTTGLDIDSLVYAQDADWIIGGAVVDRMEMSNNVYQSLPDRISMYKTSLNQLIPTGDTSISASAGDPNYSKTPAGVKFQQQSLSIDDEDFKDNLYITYAAVSKSMINTHFANMQGTDIMKLSDEQRDILMKAGLDFPVDEDGNPTNELEVIWDEARATFDFEIDPEDNKTADDEKKLEGLLKVAELRASDPSFDISMQESGKKLNLGELYAQIISLTTDNDKIIEDISPEEQDAMAEEAMMAEEQALAGEQPMAESPEQIPEETALPEELPIDMQPMEEEIPQEYDPENDPATQEFIKVALESDFTEEEIASALERNVLNG